MQQVVSARRSRPKPNPPRRGFSWTGATQLALALALALVAARLLMNESTRSPADPLAGGTPAPASPGPATGILLDLLLCLPAIIVLLRRALDPDFRLLRSDSHVPMFLLAAVAALSPLWAADRFLSIVGAAHLVSALVFLWSVAQLVRNWLSARMLAGVCVGVLLCLCLRGYDYHLVETADLRDAWQKSKGQLLVERGWKEGSYEATLFEGRILKGAPMGFSTSPNTYAALLVMFGVIAAAVAIQHVQDRDHPGWSVVPVAGALAIAPLIHWTACRAAYATPFIAAAILIAAGFQRQRIARHARRIYFAVLGLFALGALIIVQHGMRFQSLWHDSLNFRWRYWVGAYRVLTAELHETPPGYFRLLFGVGWENFGPYYLGQRLAIASEEIKDPHNFIVRAMTELGLVGGGLLIAWMLWLWWDLTRPVQPPAPPQPPDDPHDFSHLRPPVYGRRSAMAAVGLVSATAILVNIVASVDLGADPWFAFLEIARRLVFFCLLAIGLSVAVCRIPAVRSHYLNDKDVDFHLDQRPAPWVLHGVLAALATFLIHNLIEFSLFEPAPLFAFALLSGGVLGLRTEGRSCVASPTPAPTPAPTPRRRWLAVGVASSAALAWIAAAALLAAPIGLAQAMASGADSLAYAAANARTSGQDPALARDRLSRAVGMMTEAARICPYNGDYAARAARMMIARGASPGEARQIQNLLDDAVRADPSCVAFLVLRAEYELSKPTPDLDVAEADYQRALAIDPMNVRLRLEYAGMLKRYSTFRTTYIKSAIAQYELAKATNDQLSPDEVKRLSPADLARVNQALAELEKQLSLARPIP